MNEEILARFEQTNSNCFSQREIILADHAIKARY